MIDWQFKHYNDLTLNEFHDIIALRINVFVVEQNCPYQELDGQDKKAYHLIGRNGKGELVGTLRILPEGATHETVSIGRFLLDVSERGKQQGHDLMTAAMDFCKAEFGDVAITISAQKYLEEFYNVHGFKSTGKEYLEDGIPHVQMKYLPAEG